MLKNSYIKQDLQILKGYNSASWILLDYEDVIIHVFSKEDRLFYNLERIWRDGIEVNPEEI